LTLGVVKSKHAFVALDSLRGVSALMVRFLAVVIAGAYVTYRLIERPGQRFARNRLPKPSFQPAQVAPGAP